MIRILTGDYWSLKADVRINTINCVGVMGKGIALEFATRYPAMLEDYKSLCRCRLISAGNLWAWSAHDALIWNAATKYHWRDASQYHWISSILDHVKDNLNSWQGEHLHVAMPALGCANGGLNWETVAGMIIDKLYNTEHFVYCFNPPGHNLNVQIP